jgi:glycosyltransferase involved in cell wall biosynthesis
MKIAYLMLVHKNPRLLSRAIKTLSVDGVHFFVHVDSKADIGQFSIAAGDNVQFCRERLPVYWGEFSQVEATLWLMWEALAAKAGYEYFVLLQGSDYPIRSSTYIQSFFEENRGYEFMDVMQMPAPGYPLSKINKLRYSSEKPIRRLASIALAKAGLSHRDYRRYLGGLEPYAGQAWWTLSRDAVSHVVRFVESNPSYLEYFRNTFTADEMFFHTILGNSGFRERMRRNLVYVDWKGRGSHPAALGRRHLQLFEKEQRVVVADKWGSGEVLFARKFSDDRLDLVDRVDEMIQRKAGQRAGNLARPGACRSDNGEAGPFLGPSPRPAAAGKIRASAKPLVSIIIPAYNAEKFITYSVRSAVAQTWPNKEIIVVDDGSTDCTAEVAEEFELNGVRVVSVAHGGQSAAMNHGIRLARGEYIQTLDADDVLSPAKIEKQLAALNGPDEGRILLSAPWGRFLYRTQRAVFAPDSLWRDLTPVEWMLRKMNENLHMQHATWLASRELIEKAGTWDEELHYDQDGEYFCRVLMASERTRFVPESKIYYRLSGTHSVSYIGRSDQKKDSLFRSMKLHIQYIRSLEDSDRVRQACLRYMRNWYHNFYPERPDIVNELQAIAADLCGPLEPPRLRWKYAWMKPVVGWKVAKSAQSALPHMRFSVARTWDHAMFTLEDRAAESHADRIADPEPRPEGFPKQSA